MKTNNISKEYMMVFVPRTQTSTSKFKKKKILKQKSDRLLLLAIDIRIIKLKT